MELKLLTTRELIAALKNSNIDITARTIQFYQQQGVFPKPAKKIRLPGGGVAAVYHKNAIARIKKIKNMQKKRFSLREIKQFFDKIEQASETKNTGSTVTIGKTGL